MQQYINTLPNLEKLASTEVYPGMGARVYKNSEKITEGVITRVTSAGAYIWEVKENYPASSAEWYPFFCDKINWSVFIKK